MALSVSAAVANAFATAVQSALDAGSGAPTLKVYSGSKPASVATGATGTLLATFTLTDPVADTSPSGGVLTLDFNPDISTTVAATGTAGWFRVADSTGTAILDGTVGTSGADLVFGSVSWTSGGTVTLATGTITAPLS